MATEPLHPIIERLFQAIDKSEQAPFLPEAALTELSSMLLPLAGRPELVEVVFQLVRASNMLRDQFANPLAAEEVLQLAERAIPGLLRLARQRDLNSTKLRAGIAKLTGSQGIENRAPQLGEKPPANSVSLASLQPNRRLR